jgi:hypothetical protein
VIETQVLKNKVSKTQGVEVYLTLNFIKNVGVPKHTESIQKDIK